MEKIGLLPQAANILQFVFTKKFSRDNLEGPGSNVAGDEGWIGQSRKLFKNGPFSASFPYSCEKCSLQIFADDWIRSVDLWNRKQPLYQLSHNHCPKQKAVVLMLNPKKYA